MKVYETAKIRNVALVGHHGAGKTMIAEAMLYAAGAISRMGSIADKSTVSDYNESEHERDMSIFASLLHAERGGHKLNLLDTPGYPDFMSEVVASLRVADTALFVLNATEPVQVGTETAWGFASKEELPCVFVLNHCDKSGVDLAAVVSAIQQRFGRAATLLQLPAGDGTRGIVDLLQNKQYTYPEGKNEAVVGEIDAGLRDKAAEYRNTLVENIAENDEDLLMKYFDEGELSEDEMVQGLRTAVRNRQIFPILFTSATQNIGVSRLMDVLIGSCPAPSDARPLTTEAGAPYPCDNAGDAVAFVFRTTNEQHVGEYSFLRVASGQLESGMDMENAQTGSAERLGGLFVLNGRNRESVKRMNPGDLGVTVKLKDTHSNNTLRAKGSDVVIAAVHFPEPRYKAAVKAATAGEEDKLSTGLGKLVAQDPSLQLIHDTEMNQLLIGGQGEMHILIAKFRLKHRYGVDVEVSIPNVSYRETVQKSARAQYRHKKQSGGAGQFADISLAIEALEGEYVPPAGMKVRNVSTHTTDWGAKLELVDAIVSGVIDMKRFSGAIQKGIVEAMRAGPVAGYPCGDVRIVVYDGKMHSVDSNEAAFKSAARNCFRKAFEAAGAVMLEPICKLEVMLPDDYTGDVMSDLNTRRARIQGMRAEGSNQVIEAHAPEVELLRYSTQLRSLTQGRGLHTASFLHYETMPRNVQEKVAAEARKASESPDSRRPESRR